MRKLFIVSILTVLLTTPFASIEAKVGISQYGPTALCRDGTYSYSKNHRGACSWHKGVKIWFK